MGRIGMMACVAAAALLGGAAAAQETAFSYQGYLEEGGSPVNGERFVFVSLHSAEVGGTQIGSINSFETLSINDGLFTVQLDFGAAIATGEPRWLEINVEGWALSPRQRVIGSPMSVGTRGIVVDDAEHVGLGVTQPGSLLHLREEIQFPSGRHRLLTIDSHDDSNAWDLNPSSGSGMFFKVPTENGSQLGAAIDAVRTSSDDLDSSTALVLSTSQADETLLEALRIDSFGNVGIGTATPDAQLHIDGTGTSSLCLHVQAPGDATGEVIVGSPFGHVGISGIANNGNRRDIYFMDGGLGLFTRGSSGSPFPGNGLFINDSGQVGIGTITPFATLHVSGGLHAETSSRAIRAISTGNGLSTPAIQGETQSDFQFSSGVRGVASHEGPGFVFGVYGEAEGTEGVGVYGRASSNSGVNYGVYGTSLSASGYDFYASGPGVDYGSSSSRRWKTNIQPIGDPLGKLSQIRGVYYDWDAEHGGHHDVGMIAEEVGAVLPEIVQYEDNGVDAIGMDYSKLTPLLVEAVKALHAENDALKRRLEALEAAQGSGGLAAGG